MRKKVLTGFVFLGYCIPYSFFALYGDVSYGSMILYVVMIVAMGILCWETVKLNRTHILAVGNVLSCLFSCFCINVFQTEEWNSYFKPFTAVQLSIAISVVAFIVQMICHRYLGRSSSNRNLTLMGGIGDEKE